MTSNLEEEWFAKEEAEKLHKLHVEKERSEALKLQSRPKPKPLGEINLNTLIKTCESMLDTAIENDGNVDSGYNSFVFESTMEAIYGHGFFNWWNENCQMI